MVLLKPPIEDGSTDGEAVANTASEAAGEGTEKGSTSEDDVADPTSDACAPSDAFCACDPLPESVNFDA